MFLFFSCFPPYFPFLHQTSLGSEWGFLAGATAHPLPLPAYQTSCLLDEILGSGKHQVLFCEKLCRWKRLELNAWYSQASVELLAACLLDYFSVKISSYWWWHLSSGGEREKSCYSSFFYQLLCKFIFITSWRSFDFYLPQATTILSKIAFALQEVNPVMWRAPHCSWTDVS